MPELNEEVENFENEGGAVAPEEGSAQPGGAGGSGSPVGSQPSAPQGVSREEYQALAQRYGQMERWIAENFFVDEPEEEAGGPDPIQYVDQRLGPLEAMAQSFTQERGDKEFNKLVDELEKRPDIGKIHNRAIAFHFAEQAYEEVGRNARKAVEVGAQRAAAYEKELREAGRNELKNTLKRPAPGGDEFAPNAGEPGSKSFKTYDEVRDAWAAQSEL